MNVKKEIQKYKEMDGGSKFNRYQMREIELGLEHGIDVSIYADSKYDWSQMREIRIGLECCIDVREYAKPELDYDKMRSVRADLILGLTPEVTAYSEKQLRLLLHAISCGIDIEEFAGPEYDFQQMVQIYLMAEMSVNSPDDYIRFPDNLNPSISAKEMYRIRKRIWHEDFESDSKILGEEDIIKLSDQYGTSYSIVCYMLKLFRRFGIAVDDFVFKSPGGGSINTCVNWILEGFNYRQRSIMWGVLQSCNKDLGSYFMFYTPIESFEAFSEFNGNEDEFFDMVAKLQFKPCP